MAGRKSKEKGAEFERTVCTKLSLWVSDYTREDVFWRSAMSGGRATIKIKKNRGRKFDAHAGDVAATHELGHLLITLFIVECKAWKEMQLGHPITGDGGFLEKVWIRTYDQCSASRQPFLVLKQNYRQIIVVTSMVGSDILQKGMKSGDPIKMTAMLPRFEGIACVYLLKDIIARVDFDKIRKVYRS